MTVKQKSDRAYRALHQAEYVEGGPDSIEDAVCDLLTDLIHLSKDYAFTITEVLERAQGYAEAEAADR